MNKPTPGRQIGIDFILGVAVCAGGYFMLVDPVEDRAARVREKMASLAAQAGAPSRPTVPPEKAAEVLREAGEGVKEVQQRSQLARDHAALFESIMTLASRHQVRVDQMLPAKSGGKRDGKPPVPPPPPPPGVNMPVAPQELVEVVSVGYSMAVNGTYADVAAFVDGLQRELGYTRVRAVQFEPVPVAETGGMFVRASLETQHYGVAPARPFAQAAAEEAPR